MDTEHYRGDLTASLLRIEQLENELALFRSDPAYERVDVAEERLSRAVERRRRAQRLLPRALVASFALTGAFALTDPSLPSIVHALGWALSVLGAGSALVTMAALLVMTAQGARPRKLVELERQVRIAKGDVGARRSVREEVSDERPLLGVGRPVLGEPVTTDAERRVAVGAWREAEELLER